MQSRVYPTARKLKWLVSLLLLVLLAGVALGSQRWFLIPEQANLPYWQRPLGVSDDGIAAGVFYRPVEDVPADFDFHAFFDIPRAFSAPLLVEGFEVSDSPTTPPTLVELWNADRAQAVISFVLPPNAVALHNEFQAGTPFYISNLMHYKPLFGRAWFYHETLRPNISLEVEAIGVLDDGRPFYLYAGNKTVVWIGK